MSREIKAPPAVILSAKSYDNEHTIEFNEGSHRYKLDGKAAVGVTTMIKGAYPTSAGLISWMKGQTAEALFRALTVPGGGGYHPRDGFWPIEEVTKADLIKTAKQADRSVTQEAADIGTLVHEFCYLTDTQGAPNDLLETIATLPVKDKIMAGIDKFREWKKTTPKDKFVAAEGLIASPSYLFCGKFDKLADRGGQLVLSDYKTSKAIYLEQFVQLGAYAIAIEEWMGLHVDGLEILRFGKEDGEFETLLIDNPDEIQEFKKQAIRCRQTHEFRKLENDLRFKWKG